jgi:hypothetical protein
VSGAAVAFREEDHTYWRDGVRLPGVTEVLNILDPPSHYYTAQSRQRGLAVHAACHILNDGDRIRPGSLDPIAEPRVRAYEKFLREKQPVIEASELLVHHEELDYCGTLDAVMSFDSGRWLVDYKSGKPTRRVGPQTAAYREAYRGGLVRAALWLRDDGEYRFYSETDSPSLFSLDDFEVFLGALNILKWRQRC